MSVHALTTAACSQESKWWLTYAHLLSQRPGADAQHMHNWADSKHLGAASMHAITPNTPPGMLPGPSHNCLQPGVPHLTYLCDDVLVLGVRS